MGGGSEGDFNKMGFSVRKTSFEDIGDELMVVDDGMIWQLWQRV